VSAQGDFILQTIVIALMLFVLGLCLVAFLFAIPLMDRLGVTGINVVGRVFGIVLAALAVQYVLDGVMEVLTNAPGKLPVKGLASLCCGRDLLAASLSGYPKQSSRPGKSPAS
jgi:MarC family integral membrane protein